MFAWTSVQAIFCTPGGKLFRGNKQMRGIGEDYAYYHKTITPTSVSLMVVKILSP